MSRQNNIAIALSGIASLGAFLVWYFLKDKYIYQNEWAFWLLLLVPLYGVYHWWSLERRHVDVQLPTLSHFGRHQAWLSEFQVQLPFMMRALALTFLVMSLARPQSLMSWQNVSTEGIDIVISMDISASMLAKDFKPDRLESSKEVAARFVRGRPNDRIGLVVYEGEAFTQCPLTTDHNVLINLIKEIRTGMIKDGTAIGMGLATAVNRLRDSDAKSKVVILTTDGENNTGSISPLTAAEIAVQQGVRVYTIGVGTIGKALSPVAIYPDGSYKYEMADVRIDEELLTEIAALTDGKYFRATDEKVLQSIFEEIDMMEKTRIDVTEHSRRSENYFWMAALAALLIGLEFFYRQLVLQTLP